MVIHTTKRLKKRVYLNGALWLSHPCGLACRLVARQHLRCRLRQHAARCGCRVRRSLAVGGGGGRGGRVRRDERGNNALLASLGCGGWRRGGSVAFALLGLGLGLSRRRSGASVAVVVGGGVWGSFSGGGGSFRCVHGHRGGPFPWGRQIHLVCGLERGELRGEEAVGRGEGFKVFCFSSGRFL